MKVLCTLLFLAVATQATQRVSFEWSLFKNQFNKAYSTKAEHDLRLTIFKNNLKYIEEHNKLYEQGVHDFALGVNEYADMTNSEFVAFFNGYANNQNEVKDSEHMYDTSDVDFSKLAKTVDWRKEGYVTPIKNQGQCGSCWSFSATGSMEGQHFKATKKLVSLSEKNLMDCDKQSHSCSGGLMDYAFQYVIKNKGIDTEKSYPYEAKDGECRFNKSNVGATIKSFKDIKHGSEKDLKAAVSKEGPISVAIDASHMSFQLYKKGVYYESSCSSTMLDHGVLAVGYGKLEGKDYWLVKNSWGTSWGQDGYIFMSRNKDNNCGIATQASYPIV